MKAVVFQGNNTQYARHRDILNPDHERAHNKSVEIVLPSESRQPARFSIKSLR